jgi:multidrug efflux pump subunit AcrB
MPFGGTQEQLNNILKNLEDQLRNITDLKRFETSIQSANQGSLTMTFSEDGVKAGSHFKMKAAMEKFAIETGGADFVVYGVGQGFSNELKGDRFSVHLQLLGYNYEQLWDIASTIKERLLEQLRIHEVHINSERSYYATDDRYYRAIFRSPAELAQQNISTSILHQSFQSLNSNNRNLGKRHGESIRLTTTAPNDIWSFHKLPNRIETENDSAYFKQSNLLDLRIERGAFNIIRINQQYQLVIEYKFIGNHILSKKVLDEQLDTLEPLLPLGYKINRLSSYSETEEKDWQILLTIVLSMMAIFLICAVLFNSLWQAWVPIVFITPGFMGIFLATILFDFNFDQGGIASFLLVAGLGVNAALFVINDFNLAQKASPQRSALNHYLQAFNAKVMPIIYTNLSTILGLLPFVLLDKGLSFWYALSLCTISGLFLSTLGVLLFLPVIFLKSIPTAA